MRIKFTIPRNEYSTTKWAVLFRKRPGPEKWQRLCKHSPKARRGVMPRTGFEPVQESPPEGF